jgi:MoaA/NifB/PqqE/SkfB family radical SAM enzyme
MSKYSRAKVLQAMPRLPLKATLDLTYRCNNNCRHCWLRIRPDSRERQRELDRDEIKDLVGEARAMGCRQWSLSGGEPMLRPDFPDVFDYITRKAAGYTINTNGTLITPYIARLMRRKGSKLVALYGATAGVHDHVTRNPGSFEATMRGFAHLKEAGAGFVVQLIPMRDNYHQWGEMVELAQSLSRHWRCGAPWLYLSACGDPLRNQEIRHQRLDPREVVDLDKPAPSDPGSESRDGQTQDEHTCRRVEGEDRLFSACIAARRDFHVDPYGGMTFCGFIQDPALRYDLRQGSFREAWETFIPSLADKVRGGDEYFENCAACELRSDCRWCPVYGYLEHGRFSAPVEYLCGVAREARRFKENWQRNHRRYYQIAGVTVGVESDLPFTDATFDPKFERFRVDGPGEDTVTIRHHFSLPDLDTRDLGQEVYRQPPWAIYENGDSLIYLGISPGGGTGHIHRVMVVNREHTRARIYHSGEQVLHSEGLRSLSLLPTDQLLLARLLADRQACYLHSSGAILDGQGLLFAGHSEAGKSTIVKMLDGQAEILCDDRNIVRRWPDGFRVHGTWSHGEVPQVSASSARLGAILFLEKAPDNRLVPLDGSWQIVPRLLACLVKPFVTADWWEKMLDLMAQIAQDVPCYVLRFDKSGQAVDVLKELVDTL